MDTTPQLLVTSVEVRLRTEKQEKTCLTDEHRPIQLETVDKTFGASEQVTLRHVGALEVEELCDQASKLSRRTIVAAKMPLPELTRICFCLLQLEGSASQRCVLVQEGKEKPEFKRPISQAEIHEGRHLSNQVLLNKLNNIITSSLSYIDSQNV